MEAIFLENDTVQNIIDLFDALANRFHDQSFHLIYCVSLSFIFEPWIVIKCLFYMKILTLTWCNYFQYFLHLCFEHIQNIDIQHLYCKYT